MLKRICSHIVFPLIIAQMSPDIVAKIVFIQKNGYAKLFKVFSKPQVEERFGGTMHNLVEHWPPPNTLKHVGDQEVDHSNEIMKAVEFYKMGRSSTESRLHSIKSRSSVLIDKGLQTLLVMNEKPKTKRYVETTTLENSQQKGSPDLTPSVSSSSCSNIVSGNARTRTGEASDQAPADAVPTVGAAPGHVLHARAPRVPQGPPAAASRRPRPSSRVYYAESRQRFSIRVVQKKMIEHNNSFQLEYVYGVFNGSS